MKDPAASTERRDVLVDRLFESALNVVEIYCVYIGIRLGLYEALRAGSAVTASELASRTGTNERYAREWLEQQAVAGILETDVAADPAVRRYSLSTEHAEVLLDPDSL